MSSAPREAARLGVDVDELMGRSTGERVPGRPELPSSNPHQKSGRFAGTPTRRGYRSGHGCSWTTKTNR